MMQFEFFIIPVKNYETAQVELNKFLRSHRVLTVQREFVSQGGDSYVT